MKKLAVVVWLVLFSGVAFTKGKCVSGDCVNGEGVYIQPTEEIVRSPIVRDVIDGYTYEGEFKNGWIEGREITTFKNGNKFEGEAKTIHHPQGKISFYSKGIMIYANGNKYEGEFGNGMLNGQGVMSYANGDKYEGEWKDGESNGQGTITYANGKKYAGQWKNGEFRTVDGVLTVILKMETVR
jgi:hypothetical protein